MTKSLKITYNLSFQENSYEMERERSEYMGAKKSSVPKKAKN